jgi:hypothetical protein
VGDLLVSGRGRGARRHRLILLRLPWPDRSTRVPLWRRAVTDCHSHWARGYGHDEKGQKVTPADEADRRARLERARAVGLFRHPLVQELIDPGLSPAQRGRRASEPAGRAHDGPGGQQVQVSRKTTGRWRLAYQAGGSGALVPSPRQPGPRTPAEVLELAAALKRENPDRTARQVQPILRAGSGWAPAGRTVQRLSGRLELNAPRGSQAGGRCPGGLRPRGRTSCGPATRSTGRRSPAGRPTCSRSLTIIRVTKINHRVTAGRALACGSATGRTRAATTRGVTRRALRSAVYVADGPADNPSGTEGGTDKAGPSPAVADVFWRPRIMTITPFLLE